MKEVSRSQLLESLEQIKMLLNGEKFELSSSYWYIAQSEAAFSYIPPAAMLGDYEEDLELICSEISDEVLSFNRIRATFMVILALTWNQLIENPDSGG